MTKSQTEFFKMLDKKIDEVCVIPLPPFCVHVVFFFQVSWLQVLLLLLLCGMKVINKELSFPFCGNIKLLTLKGIDMEEEKKQSKLELSTERFFS